ncbi:MAG TPA: glycosyltransferase family 1 protein [Epulopiscium sp.]|nr:glycosyltransferase family 1 protein [Candidatus Epulonipiscium sp.]
MRILYFSTVNWNWIKQRPHFIAEGLAGKGIEIEYISLTPIFKQKITKCESNNKFLNINDQYVIPLASKISLVERLNKLYIGRMLDKEYDVIILTHPFQYGYIKKSLKYNPKVIYDCMDNMPYFYEGKIKQNVIMKEKQMCKDVDYIITSSSYLKERIIREYDIHTNKITVIKNAVDEAFITADTNKVELKHPNMMYVGTISKWFDYETINDFAKSNQHYTIYLIGPVDKECSSIVSNLNKNIKLVGTIPHKELKSYILSGDIMLIPFKVNELIKGVDPVKMYEYLALGKPVISSYWDELLVYKHSKLVCFYNNLDEFNECIKEEPNKIKRIEYYLKSNQEFINKNNWDKRVNRYHELVML